MYFALYLKIKNADFTGGLWWTVTYSLYCTFILPCVNYGILIWGNTCKVYLDKLIKLQKWAIRTISNSHYRSHTQPLFAKHNILKVNDMYSLELGVFMYKYSTNDLPGIFNDYFTKRSDIHGYQTRHVNDLNLTKNKKKNTFLITPSERVAQFFGTI